LKVLKVLEYLKDYAGLNRDVRVVNFPITDNCNSRCTMCNIWKNNIVDEISPEEITKVLSHSRFSKVKHLGISGGEPTLRKDLVRCVGAIVDALPLLETLSITSHGYSNSRWRRFLPLIKEIVQRRGISFSLNISIDGYGERHDLIRGISGAFSKATKTIEIAQALNVKLQLQYTISTMNVYSMQLALDYARDKNIEIIFRLATNIERLYNADRSEVFIDNEERSFVADFFSSGELLAQTRSLSRKLYYSRMQRWLSSGGGARAMPCYFKDQGMLLTSKLALYPCSVAKTAVVEDLRASDFSISEKGIEVAREVTKNKYCDSCIHDQSGAWSPFSILAYKINQWKGTVVVRKVLRLADNLLNAVAIAPFALLRKIKAPKGLALDAMPVVTIMGAYGGEHVGDAAILGGVILRLKKQFQTQKFFILSFRPDRTQKWVQSLKIEGVDFSVVKLSRSSLRTALGQSDGLVYAGGPIMDIPVNLSFYLYASLLATWKKIPFVVEGVGLGPYKRTVSKYFASLMLLLAKQITLRSKSNFESLPFYNKIEVLKVDQDPAFDYLHYYRFMLPQINYSARERTELSSLKDYIAGREKVLFVNLRPIWSAYATKGSEGSVGRIVDSMTRNVTSVINQLGAEWAVVFIPFNPDTYGFSDFSSFYQVVKGVLPSRDYYVVEYEPGVPIMLDMLGQCTHLLAMRFHACIFGLSSGLDVYGIDYQVGGRGKVAGLFDSLGSTNVSNVSELDEPTIRGWLGEV